MGYDKEIVLAFLEEVSEYVPQLQQHLATLGHKPKDRNSLEEAYRLAHSVKGSASMLELEDLRLEGLTIEQALFPMYEKKEPFPTSLSHQLLTHVDRIAALISAYRTEQENAPDLAEFDDQLTTPGLAVSAYNEYSQYNPTPPKTNWQPVYPPQSPNAETLDDLIREFRESTPPPFADTEHGDNMNLDFEMDFNFDMPEPAKAAPPPKPTLEPASPSSDKDWLKSSPLFDIVFDDLDSPIAPPLPKQPDLQSEIPVKSPSAKLYPYPRPAHEPDLSANAIDNSLKVPFDLADTVIDDVQFNLADFQKEPVHTPPHRLDSAPPLWLSEPLNNVRSSDPLTNQPMPPIKKPTAKLEENVPQIYEFDEIFSTSMVDQHVNRLQDAILPHFSEDELNQLEGVPLDSEIVISDANLLAAFDHNMRLSSTAEFAVQEKKLGSSDGYSAENSSGDEFNEISELFEGLENESYLHPVELPETLPVEEPLIGMTEEESAAVDAAVARFKESGNGDISEFGDLSEDEAAALAAMNDSDFGFDPGPLFLAEAHSDLDKLVELIGNFGPHSIEDGSTKRITASAATMRKAAEMMNLDLVARQSKIIEDLSAAITTGELRPEPPADTMLKSALEDLQFLLLPYQDDAQSFLAPAIPVEEFEEAPLITGEEKTNSIFAPISRQTQPLGPQEVDPELVEVFTSEAEEHISNLDIWLGKLEHEPNNRELVREIRRTAHTLKGSAAMVGFNTISQTGHLMEDLLDKLYDGSKEVTPEVVDLLFATFNDIEGMVRGLEKGKAEDPTVLEKLRPRYAQVLEGTTEEESEGGAIIFKPRTSVDELEPVAASEAVAARTIGEEEIQAIEAAQAQLVAVEQAEITHAPVATREAELGVRVAIPRLNEMMNQVGEMVINRTVLEQQNHVFNRSVEELSLSLKRLQRITHDLETRYEVELLKNTTTVAAGASVGAETNYRIGNGKDRYSSNYDGEFDSLEMDRYTEFHQLSREMSETVADMTTVQRELDTLRNELENLTIQQGRITDDLQERLVKVRLVPLSNLTPRLYRTVRTVATSGGKEAQFVVSGEETQVDKTIFEEIGDPLLHLIRNAVDHGLETPEEREEQGKPRFGTITFAAHNEGTQVVIEVKDDGRGIDLEMLKKRGIEKGFLAPDAQPSNTEIYDLMFKPGFSTAVTISEISGRGVGLDVVQANIANLKGLIEVNSERGKGTTFIIRLPSTLTITRAILVRSQGYVYAIPLSVIERTSRLDAGKQRLYNGRTYFQANGDNLSIPLVNLGGLLKLPAHLQKHEEEERDQESSPLLILGGAERYALQVDALVGQQEVVIKDLGTHLKNMQGLLGSTILGSGQVVLILNIYELLVMGGIHTATYSSGFLSAQTPRTESETLPTITPEGRLRGGTGALSQPPAGQAFQRRRNPLIQVVDDSLSVRKVLSGTLEKAGFRVRTSKDGQEALETIQQQAAPDLIIMDIEMPRMDGYELTAILKGSPLYRNVPIVMLTSRAGLKHRQKAEEVGADGFLVKPYKDEELLQIISLLLTQVT